MGSHTQATDESESVGPQNGCSTSLHWGRLCGQAAIAVAYRWRTTKATESQCHYGYETWDGELRIYNITYNTYNVKYNKKTNEYYIL